MSGVTQTNFHQALLDAKHPAPAGLSDSHGRQAQKRFDVYRNNVAVSLTEALETGFPVIRKLLGDENFKPLAGMFLRQFQPSSPILWQYGQEFPEFLRNIEQLAHLGYLGDVAEVELALRSAYHAKDTTAIEPEALGTIPPEQLGDVRLELAPSVRILTSQWPIYSIWTYNSLPDQPKPTSEAQDIIILRPDFDPEPHLLLPGGYEFITALINGNTLAVAAEVATEKNNSFDLGAVLTLLLSGKVITAIIT